MRVVGMIPVRLESTRLPRKPLAEIQKIPMILHTWKRSTLAKQLDEIYVVTDSFEIKKLVESKGGHVLMTSSIHQSGTDRIAEAAQTVKADYIINIQGDEALVNPEHIDALITNVKQTGSRVSILATKFNRRNSPSDIKLVLNDQNFVIYASRADIPFSKSGENIELIKAYHVVAFQKEFLSDYTSWSPTKLELIEGNEYLRILEKGKSICAVHVNSEAISVDTIEDLAAVNSLMAHDKLFLAYKEDLDV